jgi:hypothetical protein
MNRVVLIGGLGRSGTNLARRIVGSHSKIGMLPVELKYFENLQSGNSVRQILTKEKFIRRFPLDVSNLYAAPPDQVFRDLLSRYAESIGKPIAGEKSPGNEFYFPVIVNALKGFDVSFIHLVRNPFDTIASFKHAHFRTQENHDSPLHGIAARAEKWKRSLSLGLARALFQPQAYCLVKFEDLTNDAVNTTARLCEFLDVEFERDRMLSLSDFSKHRDNTSFPDSDSARSPDDIDNTGRVRALESRKGYLTEQEIQLVGSICGEMAQAIGYEDEDFNAAPPEAIASGGRVRRNIGRRIANRFFKR